MSANDHTTAHEEAHTGPIKTPQQLLAAVFFSFVVPVFAIIGLVYYVVSANKPAAGADESAKSVAQRIQKIGMVEIRDANRPLKSGEEVYKAQCVTCHGTGAAGAPKFGDAGAWAPRIKTGFDTLWHSALKGKGAMGPQGGGDFEDVEIGKRCGLPDGSRRRQVRRACRSGRCGSCPCCRYNSRCRHAACRCGRRLAAANKTASPAAGAAPATAGAAAPALYGQVCAACHMAGVANAPKLGDKAAWAPRIATGVDALTASAIKGKGAMPPKGGSTAPDSEIKAVVQYMVNAAK
jgi:cytochrome c5